jgi:hypothetical protein
MRVELLRLRRKGPLFAPLEGDLKELLVYWFDIGFLEFAGLAAREAGLL